MQTDRNPAGSIGIGTGVVNGTPRHVTLPRAYPGNATGGRIRGGSIPHHLPPVKTAITDQSRVEAY